MSVFVRVYNYKAIQHLFPKWLMDEYIVDIKRDWYKLWRLDRLMLWEYSTFYPSSEVALIHDWYKIIWDIR